MRPDYLTPLSKSLLTGLFAGIVATLLTMAYNVFYRDSTGFPLADFINVSSLIFSVNLLFLVIGVVFYAFTRITRNGERLFVAFFLVLTVILALLAGNVHRSDVPLYNKEFHQLLLPMVVVIGLVAALGIPFLYHSKKFEETVL